MGSAAQREGAGGVSQTPRGYPTSEARRQAVRAGRRVRAMFIIAGAVGVCWLGMLMWLVFAVIAWLERH